MKVAEFVSELQANFPDRKINRKAYERVLWQVDEDTLDKMMDKLGDDPNYNPQHPPTTFYLRQLAKTVAGVNDLSSVGGVDSLRGEMVELTNLFWHERTLDRIKWGDLIEKFYNTGRTSAGEHCSAVFAKFERLLSEEVNDAGTV
jgi:hypothetical protein